MNDVSTTAIDAMAFYDPQGAIPTFLLAERFAGDTGRVATLPDILEARLATDAYSMAWTSYFTTSSTEFYGLDRNGVAVIAVLHGGGPLSTKKGILAAYAHTYKDKDRRSSGGRIDGEEFLRVLDGVYGDVTAVPLVDVLSDDEYPFASYTAETILGSTYWRARLGGDDLARRYVERHLVEAPISLKEDRTAASPEKMRIIRMDEIVNGNGSYITYAGDRIIDGYRIPRAVPKPLDGTYAHANLLSIGQVVHSSSNGQTDFQTDVSPFEWSNGCRFAAVRHPGPMAGIHHGMSHDHSRNPEVAIGNARPYSGPAEDESGFDVLTFRNDMAFTQYPKNGESLDTVDYMHRAEIIEKIGDVVPFEIETAGFYGFFKYALADVRRIAPVNANAYALIGTPSVHSGGNRQSHTIQFYRVKVDRSNILPTQIELQSDYDIIMKEFGQAA